jgi:outer membrane protein OmpA-like peptidoglycan-associated protein
VREHLRPSARVFIDYAHEPLVLTNLDLDTDYVVSHQAWLHALATLSLFHRVSLSLDMPFTTLFDPYATSAHLLGTGHYRVLGGPFEVGAAFGPGIGKGVGAAAYRALFFVGYAPESPPPTDKDTDNDGVLDTNDACPTEPGSRSEDPLKNGCPVEEDSDLDGDTILDLDDACPTLPGPATFFYRTHGCPKVIDTDKDGVPDRTDACPREPGERPPSGNGCPKKPPAPPPVATLETQEITISQQVQFELNTAVLRPESDPVLTEVMRVLNENPDVELIEIQGHTDETGTEELNRRLGQERANSVLRWLVARGVARERLVAKGYGSERPLGDNSTDEGRQKNRRVEFQVVRRKSSAPPVAPAEVPK